MKFLSKPCDLTILLTLKNREVYTKNWLQNNLFPEFSYLIADGSDTDLNQKICMDYVSENVTYVRYPPDATYRIYLQKRINAMSRIQTRFMLAVDNDDFLLKQGLKEIMTEFEADSGLSLIQGTVGGLKINKNGLYERASDWKHFLSDCNGPLENLKKCLSKNYSLWYSISEVDIQRKVFDTIYASGTSSPYLTEEFQTYLSLALCRPKVHSTYYYARLLNSVGSNDSVSSEKHRFDQILDKDYFKSFSFLAGELKKYYDEIDEASLYEILRSYQISKFSYKSISLGAQLMAGLSRRFRKATPSFWVSKGVPSDSIPSLFP
jgi:glycosyltransferase domain-containing protein